MFFRPLEGILWNQRQPTHQTIVLHTIGLQPWDAEIYLCDCMYQPAACLGCIVWITLELTLEIRYFKLMENTVIAYKRMQITLSIIHRWQIWQCL